MENKAFLIRFDAIVNTSGEIQVNADNEKEALRLAKFILLKNLFTEDCLVEMDENLTLREIELLKTLKGEGYNITDIIPLN